MTKFLLNDKFEVSGTQLGLILFEIDSLDAQLEKLGVLDGDTAFFSTRETIEKILQQKISDCKATETGGIE